MHHEQILAPVVPRQGNVENITGLDAEGEEARERLIKRLAKSERVARRAPSAANPPSAPPEIRTVCARACGAL